MAQSVGRLKQVIQLEFSSQARKIRWHGSVGRAHGQSIPFKETGIDPLCLDQIDPSVHLYINEIKDILLGQLKKDNPCDISLNTLTLLGEMLLGIEQHATLKERLGLT